jgi:hypothetical protein
VDVAVDVCVSVSTEVDTCGAGVWVSVSVLVTVAGASVSTVPGAPPEECSRWVVVAVVGVVVGLADVVAGGVDGEVVPGELQATDSPPISTAVAMPVAAAHRRGLFITNDIHTHACCENRCDADGRRRRTCCQPRAGTPLGPSVECA